MVKISNIVGTRVVSSHLISSQPQKKSKIKAFSIAEAMITLTIFAVIAAAGAPLVSKQIKNNEFSDVQAKLLNTKIDNNKIETSGQIAALSKIIEDLDERLGKITTGLEDKVSKSDYGELKTNVETIEEKLENIVPKGTVAFFDLEDCPSGWAVIDASWNGRFPRFAGTYNVLSYDTSTKAFNATGTSQTLGVGTKQEDAIRNITGTGPAFIVYGNNYYVHWLLESGAMYHQQETGTTKISGAGNLGNGTNPNLLYFDASRVVPVSVENRPRSVALLGCVKK